MSPITEQPAKISQALLQLNQRRIIGRRSPRDDISFVPQKLESSANKYGREGNGDQISMMLPLLLETVLPAISADAQDVRRYTYAAVPGVSNNEQFGASAFSCAPATSSALVTYARRSPVWCPRSSLNTSSHSFASYRRKPVSRIL